MTSDSPAQDSPLLGHSVYGEGSEKVLALHDWMGNAANYEAMIPLLDPPRTHTCSPIFAATAGRGTFQVSSRPRKWPLTRSALQTTLDGDAFTSSAIR